MLQSAALMPMCTPCAITCQPWQSPHLLPLENVQLFGCYLSCTLQGPILLLGPILLSFGCTCANPRIRYAAAYLPVPGTATVGLAGALLRRCHPCVACGGRWCSHEVHLITLRCMPEIVCTQPASRCCTGIVLSLHHL